MIEKQYKKISLKHMKTKITEAAYTLETLPDILYHGSFKEFTKIQTPIFLTPFQGIASMFIVNKNELDRVMKTSNIKPPNSFQTDYKEWAYKDSKLKNPLKFVHILHNIKTLENTVLNGTSVGYIYAIDIRPIKKELELFLKSSANREVVYKGNKELKILKRIPHSIEWSFSYSLELAEWLDKERVREVKVKTLTKEVEQLKNNRLFR